MAGTRSFPSAENARPAGHLVFYAEEMPFYTKFERHHFANFTTVCEKSEAVLVVCTVLYSFCVLRGCVQYLCTTARVL